ncbi:MAG: hypothetical protein ACRCVN_00365 [Spirochaetia bacterium]
MGRDLLPNESRTGLSFFLRSLLVVGQLLILAFLYAMIEFLGKKYLLISSITLIPCLLLVWHIERTLSIDEKIRKPVASQRMPILTFVRLVILSAGLLVSIKALAQLFSLDF